MDALVADYLSPIREMNTNRTTVFVDADRIAYIAALTVANQGYGAEDLEKCVQVQIQDVCRKVVESQGPMAELPGQMWNLYWCLSPDKSFRNKVWPEYKANRIGKWTPSLRHEAKQVMIADYNAFMVEDLQADDVVGILGYGSRDGLMVSNDKDLLQVPGRHFNPVKKTYTQVSEAQGRYAHWMQWLHGDSVDNYPGLRKGFGPAKARKFLEGLNLDDPSEVEQRIQNLFPHKRLSECMRFVSGITHEPVVLEAIHAFLAEDETPSQAAQDQMDAHIFGESGSV